MDDVNKVPASAGAQWLLDGMANLRRAPLAFGLLIDVMGSKVLMVSSAFSLAALAALFLLDKNAASRKT